MKTATLHLCSNIKDDGCLSLIFFNLNGHLAPGLKRSRSLLFTEVRWLLSNLFRFLDTSFRFLKIHKTCPSQCKKSASTSTYLNSWTNHLNQTIEHTGPLSFKRFPMEKAFVDGKSCNRLALTESNILHHTVNECTNVFLQHGSPRYQFIKCFSAKYHEIWHKRFAKEVHTRWRSIGGFLDLLLGVSTFLAGVEPGGSCKVNHLISMEHELEFDNYQTLVWKNQPIF